MATPEDKKRWQSEADQLKRDLDTRQRVYKRREVPISFPKKNPVSGSSPPFSKSGNAGVDALLRQQIQFCTPPPPNASEDESTSA
jgi:hypothetical protein